LVGDEEEEVAAGARAVRAAVRVCASRDLDEVGDAVVVGVGVVGVGVIRLALDAV
jgi:hypothetical protein